MHRARATLSLSCLLIGIALAAGGLARTPAASAAVDHRAGFHATVAGWTSWYGAYGLGAVGQGWCIDHGLRAPDSLLGYVSTDVPDASDDARAAMAWVLGQHGTTDRVGSAAMMLVLHDLMAARYPTGVLDVDRLTVADLSGFEGHEAAVLERARGLKADARAHRHLRGPLTVRLDAAAVPAGAPTVVRVVVVDAAGAPVVGARVSVTSPSSAPVGSTSATTDAAGATSFRFIAAVGQNRFEAAVAVPAMLPTVWRPTAAAAQRVAQPHVLALRAAGGFSVDAPTGEIVVHKRGDAEPTLPVTGATFRVTDEAGDEHGRLVVGDAGRTAPLALDPGRYRVREVEAPTGYDRAPDQVIEVVGGVRQIVEVVDHATRGGLLLRKRSGGDGAALAGAVIEVAHDADGDGTYETPIATLTTGDDGTAQLTDLMPGAYLVTEVEAPPHHDLLAAPVPVEVPIGGAIAELELIDRARATASFQKVAVGPAPPWATMAGAVFEVVDATASQEEGAPVGVGRCATDADGRCALAEDVLISGHRHCWVETVVPPGWAAATPDCFVAGAAGTRVVVEVPEPSRFVDVTATKVDAATGEPLAGAEYDLYGTVAGPSDHQPTRSGAPADLVWIGRARSDARGALRWPLVAPDQEVCAVEAVAPDGYHLAARPVCSDAPHAPATPARLRLADVALPPPTTTTTVPATMGPPPTMPPTTTTTTTTAPPPTTSPPTTTTPIATPPAPTTPPMLPVTGGRSTPMAAAGLALVGVGIALQRGARSPRAPRHGSTR